MIYLQNCLFTLYSYNYHNTNIIDIEFWSIIPSISFVFGSVRPAAAMQDNHGNSGLRIAFQSCEIFLIIKNNIWFFISGKMK